MPSTQKHQELKLYIESNSSILVAAKLLDESFRALGYAISSLMCEEMSRFINLTMGTRNREFHDIEHAIIVAQVNDPIGKIAALFHDNTYHQVDKSRVQSQRNYFGIFDPGENTILTIPSQEILDHESWRSVIVTIFGFNPGQQIGPYTGLNEFLSAWIAVNFLKDHLNPWHVLQIIACIEATIPFRGLSPDGHSCSDKLFQNLKQASHKIGLNPSEKDLFKTLDIAIKVLNQDVSGFAAKDPAVFLANTWALLYEGNPSLQSSYYTITQYRTALQRMENFLGGLAPERVFRTFNGYPSSLEYSTLTEATRKNTLIGREYIQAKLLESTLLEAIALNTGGDAPLEIFVGNKSETREVKTNRIGSFLDNSIATQPSSQFNQEVLDLLSHGRAGRSKFDMKDSPLGAYLYERLSREQFKNLNACAQEFIANKLSATDYLRCFPHQLLDAVLDATSKMVWTRQSTIQSLRELAVERKVA